MNLNFLTEPTPHHEAIDLIRNKPAVSREIFGGLEQELKGRAMTITGIENFDLVQAVQDKIARLPAGADWKKLRKEIAADISPWLGEEEGLRRAQLLLNHHGRAAYAATNARIVHAQEDVFTHLMYRSSRTSKEPRASHKALDGLILPSKHPFWETHTPPWEFGCNCPDPIPLTAEDADDAEREKPGSVATPGQLAALERGTLSRGPAQNFDIQTPLEKSGGTTGYQWSWRDTTLPYQEIRKRWTPDVAEKFEQWASKQEVAPGMSLINSLLGATPFRESRIGSAGGRAVYPVEAAAATRLLPVKFGSPSALEKLGGKAAAIQAREEAIRSASIEHGALFSKMNGSLEWIGQGGTAEVEIPEGIPTRGRIFTHSHPGGESFSVADIVRLYTLDLREIRIATRHGIYAASRRGNHRAGEVLAHLETISADAAASLEANDVESSDPLRHTNHLIWMLVGKRGLINYSYTPMKPENPLSEALSVEPQEQPPAARHEFHPRRFVSYPLEDYRAFVEGRAEYPGLSAAKAYIEKHGL